MSTPTLSPAPAPALPSSDTASSFLSSTSYPKKRRTTTTTTTTTTRATIFLITLTLACCLLASASSTCLAAPVRVGASKSLRQRSLAHQVHHVQVADESVHNTVLLLKKSIQKRKSQNKRQQLPQQQQRKAVGTNEAMRTKRHGKREIVDSVPENRDNKAHHTASTSSSSSSLVDDNNYVKVDDASAVLVGDSIAASANARSSSSSSSIPSDHATIRPTHNGNNDSNKQKQFQKKHRAATTRLLSAYESIVFSESQIPVFLTQDHRQQRKQRAQSLRAQLKGHVRIRKGAEGTLQESDDAVVEGNNNNNNNAQRHQNPIRADTTDAEASSFSSPVDDDDVTVAQADDAHLYASSSSSASNVLDSGLEHSVAQGAVSNNNNLRSYHVDDQGDVVGVTITDDDKNSPSLGPLSHASAATVVVVQVEQEEEKVENGELSAEPTRLEAAVFEVSEEAIEGSPAAEEAVVQKEKEAAVEDESENEDEWVTIADADLVSNIVDGIVSSINSSPSSNVEFQSSESDDAPFIPFTSSQEQQRHHPTAAAAGTRLFHNGCLSSPTIASLGLLLTAIGLAYRFYIRKQQQQQKRHPVLPSDIKTAPLLPSTSSSSSKSVHRLSVDSLPSPTTREGARTTAMRDYVGFNVQ